MLKNLVYTLAVILVGLLAFRLVTIQPAGLVEVDSEELTPTQPVPVAPSVTLQPLPTAKTLVNDYHIFQTFNNCGPAALSMALSYYGITKSQYELGQDLRPYQNPQGDNDDKSTTLDELAREATEFGLLPFHRPNGTVELVKRFVLYDMPVITLTRLTAEDDIGHFRVVKGYDDATGKLLQDDSYQGHNLWYSYAQFESLWETFNYEYLVLVPEDKRAVAEAIIGEDTDLVTAWHKAADGARRRLTTQPASVYDRFNLAVALYYTGDFAGSVAAFEAVEAELPFRTLWYQIEPIEAYYELGDYDRVFELTDEILANHNRAFSELYILRGKIYQKQGNTAAAKREFEAAVLYNRNMPTALQALAAVEGQ